MAAISLSGQTRQRQIVILAVGGLLLTGLLAFQVPRMLEMMKTKAPPPPVEQTQSTPAPQPAPSPVAPVTPVQPTLVRGRALTRFKSKDPFVPQVGATTAAAPSTPAPSSQATPAPEAPTFTPVKSTGSSQGAAKSATIAVNGTEESVSVSSTFPKSNPVFRLVSLSGDTAKIGIAGGTLKGGSQTVTLTKGEPLTLLNTIDGKRYKLELVSVG